MSVIKQLSLARAVDRITTAVLFTAFLIVCSRASHGGVYYPSQEKHSARASAYFSYFHIVSVYEQLICLFHKWNEENFLVCSAIIASKLDFVERKVALFERMKLLYRILLPFMFKVQPKLPTL